MHWTALLILLLALALYWLARRLRRDSGLPRGQVVYSDTSRWQPLEKPLYHRGLKLAGRPDYLVQQDELIIPVEVKSGTAPAQPYDSHIYQLAAYCLLVEENYLQRPPYGIIKYDDRNFHIDFSRQLEEALLQVLEEMRQAERQSVVDRSHQQAARCRGCGYAAVCEQRL